MAELQTILLQNNAKIKELKQSAEELTQTMREIRGKEMNIITEIVKIEKINDDIVMKIILDYCYCGNENLSKEEICVIVKGIDKTRYVQQCMSNKLRIKQFIDFDKIIAEVQILKKEYPKWTLSRVAKLFDQENTTYSLSFTTQEDKCFMSRISFNTF